MLQRARSAGQQRFAVFLAVLCVIVGGTAVVWKAWDMFTPARRPMLQGWNDSFYYFWLPTVVINHNLDFSQPLATSRTITPEARDAGLAQPHTATGLLPNKYPPGWALGSLPFFLLAHALAPAGATGWPWLVSFGVITVLNAAWPCWWFASSFGNRGFEVPIFFAMFGIAALLAATERHPGWRRTVWATLGIAVTWNLILFGLFLTRRIPQEEAVTFGDSFRALAHCLSAARLK